MIKQIPINRQSCLICKIVIAKVDLAYASIVSQGFSKLYSTLVIEIILAQIELFQASLGFFDRDGDLSKRPGRHFVVIEVKLDEALIASKRLSKRYPKHIIQSTALHRDRFQLMASRYNMRYGRKWVRSA